MKDSIKLAERLGVMFGTALVFTLFAFLILGIIGWIMNIINILNITNPITISDALSILGAIVIPLGMIMGWVY
jgi:uncharacterized protein with PQ loop repeat